MFPFFICCSKICSKSGDCCVKCQTRMSISLERIAIGVILLMFMCQILLVILTGATISGTHKTKKEGSIDVDELLKIFLVILITIYSIIGWFDICICKFCHKTRKQIFDKQRNESIVTILVGNSISE